MKTGKLILLFAFAAALLELAPQAHAQSTATAVASCGGASYTAGQQYPLQQTQTGLQCSSATLSGSVTVGNATITAPLGAQTAGASVATTVNGALPAGTNLLGKVGIDQTTPGTTNGVQTLSGSTTAVTQATAANLNATVVNAGTFAVQIDQTTPGTTNGVVIAPSSTAGVAITPVNSASAENNHVLKNAAGNLYSAYATNLTTTAGFLEIFNATSAPADGAVTPIDCVALPPTGTASVDRRSGPPRRYSTGITAVVSSASSCFTKTTGTITAFISGDVQ